MKILFVARSTLFDQMGGDTIQIEETAKELRKLGHQVDILTQKTKADSDYDLIHLFNLIRPAQFLPFIKWAKPIVITAIYVDYSEFERKHGSGFRKFLVRAFGKFGVEYFKVIGRWLKGGDSYPGIAYLLRGHKKSIQKILKSSSHLICASKQEQLAIHKDFGINLPSSIVQLGSEHISSMNTDDKNQGISCVARIEGLKNQLNLIKALNDLQLPLSLIGNAAKNQANYFQLCKREAQANISFKGQLTKEEVQNVLSKSSVHAMVSYYETTGLSTIEALKLGNQVVISDRGGQKEIFGEHAFYADPEDTASIKAAIQKGLNSNSDHKEWLANNFSWRKAAHEISDIYQRLASNP